MEQTKYCKKCKTIIKLIFGEPTCQNPNCKNFGVFHKGINKEVKNG